MNKLYKISFVIFLVVSLISLTACGGHGGGGNNNPTPQAISEMTAVRLSVNTVISNITKILGYSAPQSSNRTSQTNLSVPEKLKNLAYGEKINKLIPANSRNEFFKGLGPEPEKKEEWNQGLDYIVGSNSDSTNVLVAGFNDKYDPEQRYHVFLYEGKEGTGTILTKIVALPTDSYGVAISYLNDGNGNKSTFVFAFNLKGEFEGRIFKDINDKDTYNSENYSSMVYGDSKQMTYANEESIEIINTKDGKAVSSSSPLIEGFKTALYALKFAGQLRTGEDGQSNSAIIKENQLSQIPQVLLFLGDGSKLDEYMNYSTIDGFIYDNDITNKFMPSDIEVYEKVRIGDYIGNLPYYSGATAEATLRLALSVIDKDSAHIVTKVAGQDEGLYIVAVSYLTINEKEYTVAVGAQMIRDSKGIFLEAKMFEGKHNDVNFQSKDNEKRNIKVIGTAKVDYVTEEDIPGTITVNGKTITFNAAND